MTDRGSCWFGGADRTFISGVVCGQANAWQMRIAYTDKAVISNNVVQEHAGFFEAIKFHCSLGPTSPSTQNVCHNMIFSENVLAKERLNIVSGGIDEGTIQDSIFERNLLPGGLVTTNPRNVHRFNVMTEIVLGPRGVDATMPRGNVFENSVCMNSSGLRCVNVREGTNADGLVLRNLLHFASGASPAEVFGSQGSGSVDQAGCVSTLTNPFAVANPSLLVKTDFALPTGSPLIDKGVPIPGRGLDLLGNAAPHGSAPDVGAIEFQSN